MSIENSSYSRQDIFEAFNTGKTHSKNFDELLKDDDFYKSSELYSITKEIINNQDSKVDSITRAYSVLKSNTINSMPDLLDLNELSVKDKAIAKCEDIFHQHSELYYDIYFTVARSDRFKYIPQIEERLIPILRPNHPSLDILKTIFDYDMKNIRYDNTRYKALALRELFTNCFPYSKISFEDIQEFSNFLLKGNINSNGDVILNDKVIGNIHAKVATVDELIDEFTPVTIENETLDDQISEFIVVDEIEDDVTFEEEPDYQPIVGMINLKQVNSEIIQQPEIIQTIFVSHLKGDDAEIQEFSENIGNCNNLSSLILEFQSITPSQASQMADSLKTIKNLSTLSLTNIKDPVVLDAFLDHIKELPHLTTLTLREVTLDHKVLNKLKNMLLTMPNVNFNINSSPDISPNDPSHLKEPAPNTLAYGIANYQQLNNAMEDHAEELEVLFGTALEENDEEINAFCENLGSCKNLHSLTLEFKTLSQKHADQILAAIKDLKNLESLSFEFESVSPELEAKIRTVLNNIKEFSITDVKSNLTLDWKVGSMPLLKSLDSQDRVNTDNKWELNEVFPNLRYFLAVRTFFAVEEETENLP